MSEFNKDNLELFLGAVRKYMQMRGPMSQKELAELTEVGVSTMSRFLNQKTSEFNPQLIAKIVAKLQIPLHEVIDFVEEDYAEKFIRLVKFFRDENPLAQGEEGLAQNPLTSSRSSSGGDEFEEGFASLGTGTAKRAAQATIRTGGKTRTLSFQPEEGARNSEKSLKEKIQELSPRQKAYMTDFLNLDMEGRDLMVDIGNNLLRFFRQRGMDF